MKFLVFTLLVFMVGCSTKPIKYSEKLDSCITKYISEGIDSDGAVKICLTIHERRP